MNTQTAYAPSTAFSLIPGVMKNTRDPTVNDIGYDVLQPWLNTDNATVWVLMSKGCTGGVVEASWFRVVNQSTPSIDTLTTDDSTAVTADSVNNTTLAGANGIETSGSGTTATVSGVDASTTQIGVSRFATNAETVTGTATTTGVTPDDLTYRLAYPPAIGGGTAAAGTFTTCTATTGNITTVNATTTNATTANLDKTIFYSYQLSMENNTTYVVTGMAVRGSFILQASGASNGGATAMFFGNDSSEYNAGTVTKQTGATKGDGTNGLTMTWPGNYGYPSISQDEGSTKAYNISYWRNKATN